MSCACRVGVWRRPVPPGGAAGGSVSGVRGGPVQAEHAAGGGLRSEGVLHGDREGPGGGHRGGCVRFPGDQRGDRTVVRLADRESGLSARTIARRLSSVSGLYAYLVARGDTPVRANPVPRGLMTRRRAGRCGRGWPRWCGCRAPCRGSCLRRRPTGWSARCARTGTGRWCWGCCWPGCAGARCWACGSSDVQVADRRLAVVEGKGGHHRVVPGGEPVL